MKTPIKLVLLYLLIQLGVGGIFSAAYIILTRIFQISVGMGQTYYLVASLLASIVLMFLYLYKFHYISFENRSWSFVSLSFCLLIIPLGLSYIFVVDYLTSFLDWMPDIMKDSFSEMSTDVLGIIMIALVGPVFEEILFRGTVTRLLLVRYSPRKAILLSALLFGIFHINPAQIVPAFLFGLVLGALYYYTKSLVPGILLHMLNNTISVVLISYYPNAHTISDLLTGSIHQYLFFWTLLAFLVFISTGYLLYHIVQKQSASL